MGDVEKWYYPGLRSDNAQYDKALSTIANDHLTINMDYYPNTPSEYYNPERKPWKNDDPGVWHNINGPTMVQHPLDIESAVKDAESKGKIYIALIGSSSANTPEYVGFASQHGIVTISDDVTGNEFTNVEKYPSLLRLRFAEEYRHLAVANFLKSRKIMNLVVLQTTEIPYTLSKSLNKFGINYVTATLNKGMNEDDVSDAIKRMKDSGLRTVL